MRIYHIPRPAHPFQLWVVLLAESESFQDLSILPKKPDKSGPSERGEWSCTCVWVCGEGGQTCGECESWGVTSEQAIQDHHPPTLPTSLCVGTHSSLRTHALSWLAWPLVNLPLAPVTPPLCCWLLNSSHSACLKQNQQGPNSLSWETS